MIPNEYIRSLLTEIKDLPKGQIIDTMPGLNEIRQISNKIKAVKFKLRGNPINHMGYTFGLGFDIGKYRYEQVIVDGWVNLDFRFIEVQVKDYVEEFLKKENIHYVQRGDSIISIPEIYFNIVDSLDEIKQTNPVKAVMDGEKNIMFVLGRERIFGKVKNNKIWLVNNEETKNLLNQRGIPYEEPNIYVLSINMVFFKIQSSLNEIKQINPIKAIRSKVWGDEMLDFKLPFLSDKDDENWWNGKIIGSNVEVGFGLGSSINEMKLFLKQRGIPFDTLIYSRTIIVPLKYFRIVDKLD